MVEEGRGREGRGGEREKGWNVPTSARMAPTHSHASRHAHADKNGVLDRDELKSFLGRMLFSGDRTDEATGEPTTAMAATTGDGSNLASDSNSVGLEDQDAWRILTDEHVELLAKEIDTENDGTEITKVSDRVLF